MWKFASLQKIKRSANHYSTSTQVTRIFSGIQPTGTVHIGNYLGAIENWIKLQNEYPNKTLYCIVDLHSLTTSKSRENLRDNTLQIAATLLACGIDPQKSILYNQSKVSGHTQLSWILTCVTPMSKLNQMIQYKEKVKQEEEATTGLFNYPILMAADILLFRASHVPVGEDQDQHLELTRFLATRANQTWNTDLFLVPETMYTTCRRVMSLKNASKKMSKSDIVETSRINMTDNADQITQKIKVAKTDLGTDITYTPDRPELANLIEIFSSFSGRKPEDIADEYRNASFMKFKGVLTDLLVDKIVPISKKIKTLNQDTAYLESVLEKGGEEANRIAHENLKLMFNKVGLG